MNNELLPNIWVFWSKFRWGPSPQIGRATWRHFGRLPLFMEQATCALRFFFPNPSGQFVHNRHLVLREIKKKQKEELSKLGTICGRYWFLNWAHIFEQHETASQNKQCQPKNKPHILGVCRIICYYGPHGSAHHPTPLDTFFHPRRLPPRGSQTQVEY